VFCNEYGLEAEALEASELSRQLTAASEAHEAGDEALSRSTLLSILEGEPGSIAALALYRRLFGEPPSFALAEKTNRPGGRPWGFGEAEQQLEAPKLGSDWSEAIDAAWGTAADGSVFDITKNHQAAFPAREALASTSVRVDDPWGDANEEKSAFVAPQTPVVAAPAEPFFKAPPPPPRSTLEELGRAQGSVQQPEGAPPAPALEMLSEPAEKDKAEVLTLPRDELDSLMSGAKELIALADFSGALELLERASLKAPGNALCIELTEQCENTLTQMMESKLAPLDRCPRVLLDMGEIVWLNLDHRAGFILAQIDGAVSYEEIFALSGMSRLDTCRILVQLIEQRVISA